MSSSRGLSSAEETLAWQLICANTAGASLTWASHLGKSHKNRLRDVHVLHLPEASGDLFPIGHGIIMPSNESQTAGQWRPSSRIDIRPSGAARTSQEELRTGAGRRERASAADRP